MMMVELFDLRESGRSERSPKRIVDAKLRA